MQFALLANPVASIGLLLFLKLKEEAWLAM